MKVELLNMLETLSSSRVSSTEQRLALSDLERLFANLILNPNSYNELSEFLSHQDSFQCNVASRIITWVSLQTTRIIHLASQDVNSIFSNMILALSIVQGIVLLHEPSKLYLGCKSSIETLLDVLLVSRNASLGSLSSGSVQQDESMVAQKSEPSLASTVLDTLICVMVDSPPALRVFEAASGIEIITKLLKRSGTVREVRMKCLEFLYFYLLDEKSIFQDASNPSLPNAELHQGKNVSDWKKESQSLPDVHYNWTDRTPSTTSDVSNHGQPKSYPFNFLQREVDYTPLSPKKFKGDIKTAVESPNGNFKSLSASLLRESSFDSDDERDPISQINGMRRLRSTEEKRNLLAQNLGNVDILIEGVKKAGIWGLG